MESQTVLHNLYYSPISILGEQMFTEGPPIVGVRVSWVDVFSVVQGGCIILL